MKSFFALVTPFDPSLKPDQGLPTPQPPGGGPPRQIRDYRSRSRSRITATCRIPSIRSIFRCRRAHRSIRSMAFRYCPAWKVAHRIRIRVCRARSRNRIRDCRTAAASRASHRAAAGRWKLAAGLYRQHAAGRSAVSGSRSAGFAAEAGSGTAALPVASHRDPAGHARPARGWL